MASTDYRTVLADRASSHEAKVKALASAEKDKRDDAWRAVASALMHKNELLQPHLLKALKRTKANERALAVVASDPAQGDAALWLDACRVLRSTKPKAGNASGALRHTSALVRQEGALVAIVVPLLVSTEALLPAVNDADSTVRDFAVQALQPRLTPEIRRLLQERLAVEDNTAVKLDLERALAAP